MYIRTIFLILFSLVVVACTQDPIPKPKAFLRLEYPPAQYVKQTSQLPFTFEKNRIAKHKVSSKTNGDVISYNLDLEYPLLKGTIYITYKKVNKDNLKAYLLDAQNFTQKHAVKADEIIEQVYQNPENKTYGMLYEVGGNAASQSQFYVTDSLEHFVSGSLYFYAKPNYDSILPAAYYLKKDIQHFMETLIWKQ